MILNHKKSIPRMKCFFIFNMNSGEPPFLYYRVLSREVEVF